MLEIKELSFLNLFIRIKPIWEKLTNTFFKPQNLILGFLSYNSKLNFAFEFL